MANMSCFQSLLRRSLRGNVDRNVEQLGGLDLQLVVVPYVGTWIEIRFNARSWERSLVGPYVGTWIEIHT